MWMSLERQAPCPSHAGLACQLWGPPGSQGCLVTRQLTASWSCQGRLLTDNLESLRLETWREGQDRWGQQDSGRGQGSDGKRVSPSLYSRHRALTASQKGAGGKLREHWAAALSLPVARKHEGRLEAGTRSETEWTCPRP